MRSDRVATASGIRLWVRALGPCSVSCGRPSVAPMDVQELLSKVTNDLTVKRVFGEPIEHDGTVLVPVARVRGGAGGGTSTAEANEGSGGGGGVDARPVGVFVVKEGVVSWQPAIDVTRVAIAGQVLAAVMFLVLRSVLRRR